MLKKNTEMAPLNLDDIDVEELEERLELAIATAICDCGTNCNKNSGPVNK